MIASLDEQAQETGSEAAWLRLARWLRWADAGVEPDGALRRGLEAIPQSTALQEALAVQLADSGDFVAAIEALKRLAELAPERRRGDPAQESAISNSIGAITRTDCGFSSPSPKSRRIGRLSPILRSPSRWVETGSTLSKPGSEPMGWRRQARGRANPRVRSSTRQRACSSSPAGWIFSRRRASRKGTLRRARSC